MYVGNNKAQKELTSWIQQSYTAPSVRYCVLEGTIGNGKTSMVYHIASLLDLPVYHVCSEDITTKEEFNSFLQGLNLHTLEGATHKIVLIDDIEEFKARFKAMEIHKHTTYPVIYTTSNAYKLNTAFVRNSLHIKLKKPNPKTLLPLLREQASTYALTYTDEELYSIAKRSPSVRSALISVLTGTIRQSENKKTSYYFDLMSVRNKTLMHDFSYSFLEYSFRHIYDFSEETIDIRKQCSYLDYHVCREHFNNKSILLSKEFLNLLPYSLDCIKLKAVKKVKTPSIKPTPKKEEKKKEEKKQASILDFF